ncbi:hypothetical protein [Flavobacterium sp. CAN_S2]
MHQKKSHTFAVFALLYSNSPNPEILELGEEQIDPKEAKKMNQYRTF